MVMLNRLIDIGQRLRLNPLRRIYHQQCPLAGGKAARYLIGKINMTRRIHQAERISLAILGDIVKPHRLRLDGDPALALNIHIVEHLLAHLALGKRRFAMIDMGDDREVADVRTVGHPGALAGVSTYGKRGNEAP